jgi:hypothetical protein
MNTFNFIQTLIIGFVYQKFLLISHAKKKEKISPAFHREKLYVLRVLFFNESRDGILFFENKTFTPRTRTSDKTAFLFIFS